MNIQIMNTNSIEIEETDTNYAIITAHEKETIIQICNINQKKLKELYIKLKKIFEK